MDPISAIGVASGAITFVGFTYKFVSSVYTILNDGQSPGYESLEEMCQEMRDFATQFISQSSSAKQSSDEMAIISLANRCRLLSADIIKRIEKTKPTKRRVGEVVRAALRTVCSKDDILQLQRNLESCRGQLHLQLSMTQSARTIEALQRLELASDSFRDLYERSLEIANQRAILQALRFSLMDERYQDVSQAEKDTFEWIFKDSGAQTSCNPKLSYSFKDWLATGSGIFHLSGKPGSGKSTLMKFLCKHEATTSNLKRWAGDKKLVRAWFFFWKPGSLLQKSLLGLIRALAFHVLDQCPEIIPCVFPQYWDPAQYESWKFQPTITLGNDEFLDAFNALILNKDIYDDHRFCFFIDGLDEFEERFRTYIDLINSLQKWVKASHGHLKICVSSRELPAFQQRLEINQRIRLQDLTKADIETVVRQTLEREGLPREFEDKYGQDLERLQRRIVDKADGVFLWVVFTLKMLCEGIHCGDSISDLYQKLDLLPRELEEFFRYILDSISKDQRKKAYCTLAFAMDLDKRLDDEGYHPLYLFTESNLLRYSFLNDFIDNPGFAKNRPFKNVEAQELRRQLTTSAIQITGRSKGLLELRMPDDYGEDSGSTTNITRDIQGNRVTFTHRSIPELLDEYLQESSKYLKDFDVLEARIQTLLAVVKCLPFSSDHGFNGTVSDTLYNLVHCVMESQLADKTPYFKSLDILDKALHRRQLEIWPDFAVVQWTKFMSTTWNYPDYPMFYSVFYEAVYQGFHEYVTWKAQNCPQLLQGQESVEVMTAIIYGVQLNRVNISKERISITLNELFQSGVSPNSVCNHPQHNGNTVWGLLLMALTMRRDQKSHIWLAIEQFLRFGADTPLWIRACVGEDKEQTVVMSLGGKWHDIRSRFFFDLLAPEDLPISLEEEGEMATLQDFVDSQNPENAEEILQLLAERKDEQPPWLEARPNEHGRKVIPVREISK